MARIKLAARKNSIRAGPAERSEFAENSAIAGILAPAGTFSPER
jgi:hypothetical protein